MREPGERELIDCDWITPHPAHDYIGSNGMRFCCPGNRSAQTDCGCGHPVTAHRPGGECEEWWRYPDVLNARRCGCRGVWRK